MLGESAIKLGALGSGRWQCSTLGCNTVPDIVYRGKTFLNWRAVDAPWLEGCTHSTKLKK